MHLMHMRKTLYYLAYGIILQATPACACGRDKSGIFEMPGGHIHQKRQAGAHRSVHAPNNYHNNT